jgi:4-hydroxy-tetrahydrodipicolinate synthase
MTFTGTFTALITPFRADGSLDLDTLGKLVEWQIEQRIDGLVPCGSTGESATLTPQEHVEVIRHVVDVAGHRVPVIAGTGSNSTREAIEFTSEARRAGADAALLISPYYNKPTQDGIFHHYRTIAEQTGLPLVVYNIPGRTASRIEPETIARLSRVEGIVGLKEAGGDLVKSAETMARADPAFDVLSGDDALTLPLLALGGRGVISTTANVAPREMAEITRAFHAGDAPAARAMHYRLLELMQALFVESNPIPLKMALHLLGRLPDPALRLPLTSLQKANRDRLEAALEVLERE